MDEVRHRLDIVDVVAQYVPLKRQGGRYVGLCPFHSEKTPSFSVSGEKQVFHCFGCGVHGDVFSFVMLRENLSFPEVLRKLAEQAGVTLPEKELTPAQREARSLVERGYALHQRAAELFFQCLREDARARVAREYFHRRGLQDSVIIAFSLGFAPPGWDFLYRRLLAEGYRVDELERFGLAVRRPEGEGAYDRFRDRVMFPIHDVRGRVIGFGGRVLDDTVPKYLNSPETALFKKGQQLYGLHKAGPAIRQKGLALLVEGYMDVIACHQYGIPQAVATLGTALTADQGRLLLRYASQVVIGYDSDKAGMEATVKAGRILVPLGAQVKVISLPDGKDPDEYLQKHGTDAFWRIMDSACSFFEFRYRQEAAQHDGAQVDGKVALVRALAPDILMMRSPVEQEATIHWLARQLYLAPNTIESELRGIARNGAEMGHKKGISRQTIPEHATVSSEASPAAAKGPDGASRLEQAWRYLIHWMTDDGERVRWLEQRLGDQFPPASPEIQTIVQAMQRAAGERSGSLTMAVTDQLAASPAGAYYSSLLLTDWGSPDEATVEDCVNILRYAWMLSEIERLELEIAVRSQQGDLDTVRHILPQLTSLQQARNRAARIYGAMPLGTRWNQRLWHKGGTTDER
ncbi:DNA primase [Heliophilum fasciatum]|uniref:DNA primase n=1 Tax=Heliophilum fasciatum TaxID=35700 RepID=A0A4R2RTZ8_9FIRM|nr:DNA primase [Heliophilum fasciatum]